VGDREVNLQQLPKRYLGGIVDDLDGFGVIGLSTAYGFVVGGSGRASHVSGSYRLNALKFPEDGFDTPEATAGKDGDLRRL
jgi:hypothetical protein